ncbi:DddA-like double-stranded DNA deaminase toxin [Saccharothrix sp. HUAS TT1]|uniref:DddA-like double-stranded DNA deaminase toxin n=1 Tax=unclassified Saccharothrix TaxID=2593673 RepID=UPI00345BBEDE
MPKAQAAGWWLHSDGSRTRVLSGEDDDPNSWQKQAEQFLKREFPGKGPALAVLAKHVEIKIAIRLLGKPPTHEVVVMDRVVCGRDPKTARYRYTCDGYLPAVLEEGTTLTVVEPDGTRVTYRGKRAR